MRLAFEQWAGTRGPLAATPERRPDSVRRTTSIQTIWPGEIDLASDLTMIARGQDVLTAADGSGEVFDTAAIELRAAGPAHTVTAITAKPAPPELDAAIGASLMGGSPRAISTGLPDAKGWVLARLPAALPAAMIFAAAVPIRYGIETPGFL